MRVFASTSAAAVALLAIGASAQFLPEATPMALEKRQVAAGGGGGTAVTMATLQSINGYTPPPSSALPSPTNYSSGSIIGTAQIPGWNETNRPNSGQAVYGGGANRTGAAPRSYSRTEAAVIATAALVASTAAFMLL